MVTLKVHGCDGPRRLRLPLEGLSFETFSAYLLGAVGNIPLVVRYEDEEGDWCVLNEGTFADAFAIWQLIGEEGTAMVHVADPTRITEDELREELDTLQDKRADRVERVMDRSAGSLSPSQTGNSMTVPQSPKSGGKTAVLYDDSELSMKDAIVMISCAGLLKNCSVSGKDPRWKRQEFAALFHHFDSEILTLYETSQNPTWINQYSGQLVAAIQRDPSNLTHAGGTTIRAMNGIVAFLADICICHPTLGEAARAVREQESYYTRSTVSYPLVTSSTLSHTWSRQVHQYLPASGTEIVTFLQEFKALPASLRSQIWRRLGERIDRLKAYDLITSLPHNIPAISLSHPGVRCDGCQKADFWGFRFKALDHHDFDFCSDCYLKDQETNPSPHTITFVQKSGL